MDPLTHALVGGAVAQAAFGGRLGRPALLIGGLAALQPDVDVFIRSSADPLLVIEHHRGFTHALAFAPVGGGLAALPWLASRRLRERRSAVLGAALLGYATHGPLDAATTYGTQLFWPFSRFRVGLDWISIIDPTFTLVLLIGVLLAVWLGSRRAVGVALVLCSLYIAAGAVQRERAIAAQMRIAAARGHELSRGAVFPTIGNHLVWRSLYQHRDTLYSDRIRVGWRAGPTWAAGAAVPLLTERDLPPRKRERPRLLADFRRFVWFSDGWVARSPADPAIIGDARYSLVSDGYEPVWGIRLDPADPERPTAWVDRSRERRVDTGELWREITGQHPHYRAVPERPAQRHVARDEPK